MALLTHPRKQPPACSGKHYRREHALPSCPFPLLQGTGGDWRGLAGTALSLWRRFQQSPRAGPWYKTLREGSQSAPQQTLDHLCRRWEIWGHALRIKVTNSRQTSRIRLLCPQPLELLLSGQRRVLGRKALTLQALSGAAASIAYLQQPGSLSTPAGTSFLALALEAKLLKVLG